MTVLVLEDRDLMALASRTAPPEILAPDPVTREADIPRPQTSRFHFAFGSHRLDAGPAATLRKHGHYLKANPQQKLYLTGHSDSQGAEPYNRSLSRLRAADAARILKAAGARERQIEVAGVGSDQPLDPKDHNANRRVELRYGETPLAVIN